MRTSDFDFELPQELIAQTPILNRDQSRLLVLDKKTGEVEHHVFKDIIDYFHRPISELNLKYKCELIKTIQIINKSSNNIKSIVFTKEIYII